MQPNTIQSKGENLPKKKLFLITIFILGVLGFQTIVTFRLTCPPVAVSSLTFLRRFCSPAFYPFIDYPMYKEPHFSGERISQKQVVGLLPGGAPVGLPPEDLGLNFWKYLDFIQAIEREDASLVSVYVDLYQRRTGQRLSGLRLEDHPLVITPDGLQKLRPRVLKEFPLNLVQGRSP